MGRILQLVRSLEDRPEVPVVDGLCVRNYRGGEDIAGWLALRKQAFAGEAKRVRGWTPDDFQHEMLAKPWWSPERMWLVETEDSAAMLVGAVTMALRGSGDAALPAVHWLMVLPDWRRRGVGRLLLRALEASAWDAGFRQVCLETHIDWSAATAFYQNLGYQPEGTPPS